LLTSAVGVLELDGSPKAPTPFSGSDAGDRQALIKLGVVVSWQPSIGDAFDLLAPVSCAKQHKAAANADPEHYAGRPR
jgi:hypothetical protein